MAPVPTPAVVIGGGPTGLVAALALARLGVPAAVVAPPPAAAAPKPDGGPARLDNRTTALMRPSVTALTRLGVWRRCRHHAAPLAVMRIVDDTGRLWRAPEVKFAAAEIGLPAFAWNIENRHLVAALWECAATEPLLTRFTAQAASFTAGPSGVAVALTDGTRLDCSLVIAADGRHSLARESAGIAMTSRRWPQTALTFTFTHARPHHGISTEFHTAHGPFTVVPLPGNRSSLVWMTGSGDAERLAGLDSPALDTEIERRCHSILGRVEVEPVRGMFEITVATARRFGAGRVAVVGEAAHVFPPIGAQGLNLSLRDAATVAEIAAGIHRHGGDLGDAAADYDRRRRADIMGRTVAVDLLNRSLLSDVLAVQGLRGLGLYALDRIGPLRRSAMREGVAPRAGLPGLMVEEDG